MIRNVLIITALTIIAAITWRFLSSDASQSRDRGPTPVVLHSVTTKPLEQTIEAIGSARAQESVTITGSVTEKIESIHFQQGQKVDKGTLLVSLNSEEEEAQLKAARVNLSEQKREYKRIENLVKQKSVSASELDRLQSSIDLANARIKEAQAKIADRRIRAPFSGQLGLRFVSPGALLSPGDSITTLDKIDQLEVEFEMAETYLPYIQPNQSLNAISNAYPKLNFNGQIKTLDSRIDNTTRSIRVRATIDNQDQKLKPGMMLVLRIISEQRQAIMIPEEAIFMRAKQHYVYIVDKNMVVNERAIKVGLRTRGEVEVIEGLKDGEQIVHQGLLKVRPGSQVEAQVETWREGA
ncbi:efflux RND transporter periplasmic adaptor subunit [Bermanella marisrubri]|uniref:HlyD family-related protein n=1 Tax=Bermanella marisrubri TaxID=207949 RepID=Q1N3E4_9GAMM|nr:efflux RND transporter periplasmic adaptor subunit [Bermanella marisrubri]EAT12647.1 HlyD family-related protein [Oceanobacter sp. RED65] [Bermanella marisrubri]QIZ85228.1 efflux RND transporter periplasmic adaptor subunit [Bermanella marisrubri]